MDEENSRIYSDIPIPKREERKSGRERGPAGEGSAGPGRSPWNYITEEDLFRDFSDEMRRRQEKENEKYEAWRAKIRAGEPTSDPYAVRVRFARRYVTELLGKDRKETAEEGWEILKHFGEEGADGLSFSGYLPETLAEIRKYYVIMSDLPRKYTAEVFAEDIRKDEKILALLLYDEADDDEVYEAVSEFGKYNGSRSHFFEEHEEEMKHVIRLAYGAYADAYGEKYGRKLTDDLFGEPDTRVWYPYQMVHASLPQDLKKKVFTYQVDPILTYTCRRGNWTVTQYFPGVFGSKIIREKLGQVCRETERLLRDAAGYRKLKLSDMDEDLRKLIKGAVGKYLEEKAAAEREKARPKIRIDLSRLSTIRSDADYTRDQLLEGSEEELPEPGFGDLRSGGLEPGEPDAGASGSGMAGSGTEVPKPEQSGQAEEKPDVDPYGQAEEKPDVDPYGLSSDELQVLHLLLAGEDPSAYIREHRLFSSIIADSINEKLFDKIGDSVIEETDDGLALIEDYIEDLRGL